MRIHELKRIVSNKLTTCRARDVKCRRILKSFLIPIFPFFLLLRRKHIFKQTVKFRIYVLGLQKGFSVAYSRGRGGACYCKELILIFKSSWVWNTKGAFHLSEPTGRGSKFENRVHHLEEIALKILHMTSSDNGLGHTEGIQRIAITPVVDIGAFSLRNDQSALRVLTSGKHPKILEPLTLQFMWLYSERRGPSGELSIRRMFLPDIWGGGGGGGVGERGSGLPYLGVGYFLRTGLYPEFYGNQVQCIYHGFLRKWSTVLMV